MYNIVAYVCSSGHDSGRAKIPSSDARHPQAKGDPVGTDVACRAAAFLSKCFLPWRCSPALFRGPGTALAEPTHLLGYRCWGKTAGGWITWAEDAEKVADFLEEAYNRAGKKQKNEWFDD